MGIFQGASGSEKPPQGVCYPSQVRYHGEQRSHGCSLLLRWADGKPGWRAAIALCERNSRRPAGHLERKVESSLLPFGACAGTFALIPFNRPKLAGKEIGYIREAISSGQLAGDGVFTFRCQRWLAEQIGAQAVLLTHSCTAALEMAAILIGIKPGDEVIMPSFTFVSTANAVVLRGGVPVFVDIRADTLNIDEEQVESAITPRTRALFPIHYAGVPAEMGPLGEIADRHGLTVVEDAAQALGSTYRRRKAGSMGHLAAFSFHETKNIISGEGGALALNDPDLIERAEIIREKGTNRKRFLRGQVDKYTWVDVCSSFLPGGAGRFFFIWSAGADT